jgi:hypothetical protein
MSASGLPMQLTLPCDARFRPLAISLARRVAESLGFSATEALAFGEQLADESVAAARRSRANPNGALDVTFELSERTLRARATCAGVAFEIRRALPGA